MQSWPPGPIRDQQVKQAYLSAVLDSLQDAGEVGSVIRIVLPTLGHDAVAVARERGVIQGHMGQGTFKVTWDRVIQGHLGQGHSMPHGTGVIQGHMGQGSFRVTWDRGHARPHGRGVIQGHMGQGSFKVTHSTAPSLIFRWSHGYCKLI